MYVIQNKKNVFQEQQSLVGPKMNVMSAVLPGYKITKHTF